MWAILMASCTGVAVGWIEAILIQETKIMFLLEGVVLTEWAVTTKGDAVLKMSTLDSLRVNNMPLTFISAMAFSCWATVMENSFENEYWIWKHSAYSLCPLMHSGQSPVSGNPDSVQLEKSMHIECVGSHDHHSQSSFFPQVLWQVSGSRAFPRKLTEYSWI